LRCWLRYGKGPPRLVDDRFRGDLWSVVGVKRKTKNSTVKAGMALTLALVYTTLEYLYSIFWSHLSKETSGDEGAQAPR